MSNLNGIHTPATLSDDDWSAVEALAAACRAAEHIEMPVHDEPSRRRGETNHFLYYQNGNLIGFASLSPGVDVEVLGMVHPNCRRNGIGRTLQAAVVDECRNRHVGNFLLVCEAKAASGCAFAEALGGNFEFAEYRMELERANSDAVASAGSIDLTIAGLDDVDALVAIRTEAQEGGEASRGVLEAWVDSSAHEILIAREAGEAVGMIRVTGVRDQVWLTSFAVVESARGRGVGRRILETVIGGLDRSQQTVLEVETDNANALALYKSVGFCERATYRYYRLNVD